MKKNTIISYPLFIFFSTLLISHNTFAESNFTIVPSQQLPNLVYPGTTVRAFYTITNQTSSTRTGYSIKGLPSETTSQNTSGTNCKFSITLAPGAHCTLQIDITGEVHSNFAICHGSNCTKAAVPLSVQLSRTLQPMIAAGNYNTLNVGVYPLLASRKLDGEWSYPNSIQIQNGGQFLATNCTNNVCIAAGDQSNQYPLLTQSSDGGASWIYPPTITTELPTNFVPASYTISVAPQYYAVNGFDGVSCYGSECVAVGSYATNSGGTEVVPLLAESHDGGLTWSYPNIETSSAPQFLSPSAFFAVSCNGQSCVATGVDYHEDQYIPLLAVKSINELGSQWTYPASAIMNNPNHDSLKATAFDGVSCSSNRCVAVGFYLQDPSQFINFPLLAESDGSAKTWTYPESINAGFAAIESTDSSYLNNFTSVSCNEKVCMSAGFTDGFPMLASSTSPGLWSFPISTYALTPETLPSDIIQNGSNGFSSISCADSFCVAVGGYVNASGEVPLLGQSSDNGVTWNYPVIPLPSSFAGPGWFNTVSCSGSVCTAAGLFFDENYIQWPLLAETFDGGISWHCPGSVIDPSKLPSNFLQGQFIGSSVSVPSFLPESLKGLQLSRSGSL